MDEQRLTSLQETLLEISNKILDIPQTDIPMLDETDIKINEKTSELLKGIENHFNIISSDSLD
ncbi:hypothetical protein ACEI87_10120 [Clostridioides difficile]